ncbi:hypothetical protein M758_UG194500, partial [Ceratodon purpureus]
LPDVNIHRGNEEVGGVQPYKYYHNVSCIELLTFIRKFCIYQESEKTLFLGIWQFTSTSELSLLNLFDSHKLKV